MEFVYTHLFADGAMSLRAVLRLVLLSGLLTTVCMVAFPQNAPTRRLLLLAAISLLVVIPVILGAVDAHWYIMMDRLPSLTLSAKLPNVLLWIWLTVGLGLISQHILGVRRELIALRDCHLIDDASLLYEVRRMAADMAIETPLIRQGEYACATTLIGNHLILPASWQNWDEQTLTSVLAHELTHVRRFDDRWLLAARILVLCYWWMPWLTRLYGSYVQVMEESCDDAASEYLEHPHHYVGALVNVAKSQTISHQKAAMQMGSHHLVGRVGRFTQPRALELDTSGVYWSVMAVLLAVLMLSGIEPRLKPVRPAPTSIAYPAMAMPKPATPAIYPVVLDYIEPAQLDQHVRQQLQEPIHEVEAVYPGLAINRQLQAEVTVEFSLAQDGAVIHARTLPHSFPEYFSASALRAVRGSQYRSRPAQGLRSSEVAIKRRGQSRETLPPNGLERIQRHFKFRLYDEPT